MVHRQSLLVRAGNLSYDVERLLVSAGTGGEYQMKLGLPDEYHLIFRHLLRGELSLSQQTGNRYIEDNRDLWQDQRIREIGLSFGEDLISVRSRFKAARFLPICTLSGAFRLEEFTFKPGAHTFTFRLVGRPGFYTRNRLAACLLGLIALLVEKLGGQGRILHLTGASGEFISWKGALVTFDLDKQPEISKYLEREISLGRFSCRIFDYVTIKEIRVLEGELLLKPGVLLKELSALYGGTGKIISQIFNLLIRVVRRDPVGMRRRVETSLWDKVKGNAQLLGGKLLEGINYLWEAMADPKAPLEAKLLAIGALVYFISPLDAIPDFLPLGFSDDASLVAAMVVAVGKIMVKHEIGRRKQLPVNNREDLVPIRYRDLDKNQQLVRS